MKSQDAHRAFQKALRLNARAIAVERNPDFFSRARGKIWWEKDKTSADMRSFANEGNEPALVDYIATHKAELEAELQARREVTKAKAIADVAIPMSHQDWVKYLEQHEDEFADLMKTSTKERRKLCERLKPAEDMGETAAKIYPQNNRGSGHAPHFSHLKSGFSCFKQSSDFKFVCHVASIGWTVFACPLAAALATAHFDLEFSSGFHRVFRPIGQVLDNAGVFELAEVFALVWAPTSFAHGRVQIKVTGAEQVLKPRRAPRDTSTDATTGDNAEDADIDTLVSSAEHAFTMFDSDLDSICSSEDTESVEAVSSDEVASDSSEELGDKVSKKAAGTHVVYSNGYFTFSDNRDYPDVKVHAVTRWCTPDHLGSTSMSKTVVPAHFDDARDNCWRSMCVLKAWMLMTSCTNDFANKRASRRNIFSEEAIKLRDDIIARSSALKPTTGNDAADKLIVKWAPNILKPVAVEEVY